MAFSIYDKFELFSLHSDGETQLNCKTMKWGSLPRLGCTQETNTKIFSLNYSKFQHFVLKS